MAKQWPPERDAVLREMFAAGASWREIAAQLGDDLTRHAVKAHAARLGLSYGLGEQRWTPERVETLSRLWREGLSYAAIAERLGPEFNRGVVGSKLQRLGLARAERRATPPAAPRSMLRAAAPAPEPAIDALEPLVGSLLELRDGQCRRPYGLSDFHFCGRPVARRGAPYCAAHEAAGRSERQPKRPPGGVREGRRGERRERVADLVEMFGAAR